MNIIDKILNKLESYLQLDVKYYIKNVAYLMFSNVILALLGLLLSVALARLLPKDIYGQYSYIMSIFGLLAFFSLPGMNTAIAQAIARNYERAIIEGSKVRFKWSILGSIIISIIALYYFISNNNIVIVKCLIVCSLFFPLYYATDVIYAYFIGIQKFNRMAKYQILTQGISTFITIFLSLIHI